MEVLFIYGPAAAGKYTIGSLISESINWPLFHNHLVVDAVSALFAFGTPGFRQLRAKMWLDAFQVAVDESQSFVFTFNPENTVDPDLLKQLGQLVSMQGGQIHYIELKCDDDVLVTRMDSASRQQFNKLTDSQLFLQLKQQGCFEFPVFCLPSLTIDSGKLSAEESAQVVVRWYQNNCLKKS